MVRRARASWQGSSPGAPAWPTSGAGTDPSPVDKRLYKTAYNIFHFRCEPRRRANDSWRTSVANCLDGTTGHEDANACSASASCKATCPGVALQLPTFPLLATGPPSRRAVAASLRAAGVTVRQRAPRREPAYDMRVQQRAARIFSVRRGEEGRPVAVQARATARQRPLHCPARCRWRTEAAQ
eukprot:2634823-Pleurochrysis_carterae.AAC.1